MGAAESSTDTPVSEWRSNWPLVISGLFGLSTTSVAVYALGQFMAPLEQEFGWSRTQVSAGLSVSLVLSFLATPLVGRLIDKANARLLAIPGLIVVGLALTGFSLATDSVALWIALWSIHAVATAIVGPTIWAAVISGAFERGRSLAIAVTLCGINLASAFAPAVARLLLDAYGWRAAFQLLGLIWVVPALILTLLFFHDHRDRSPPPAAARTDGDIVPRTALLGVFLTSTFIRLALAVAISGTVTAAFTIHLAPALMEKGLTATMAATVAGAAGLASAMGKLVAGSLYDRLGTGMVAFLMMGLFALASALLAYPTDSLILAIAASALVGMAAGGNFALFTVTSSRIFSTSVFGVVYGTLMSMSALSAAIGPLVVSTVYDTTGSYAPAFWAGIGIALVTALLMQRLSPVTSEG